MTGEPRQMQAGRALLRVADAIESGRVPVRSAWVALNGACHDTGGYSAFQMLCEAAGVKHIEYLPSVLKARYAEPAQLVELMRKAATL